MEFARLPRFKRTQEIAPMQLTERDREIVQLMHRHRFLRSKHVIALIGESSQQVLRRLQLLFHHGYLERPRAQIDYYRRGGSRHIVYGIGNKGVALLRQESGPACRNLNWSLKNRGVRRLFLEHTLLVSDVMVSLELACRKSGRVRLLTGDQLPLPDELKRRREPFRWRVSLDHGQRLGLIPDAVFALEFTDQPAGRNRAFFFLEADRATMPVMRQNLAQTSFYRKLLAYEATWRQGIHRSRFGFHRFRVLTVTSSPQRVESLVGACESLERGHGLFLFADRHSLAQADPLAYDWKAGRPHETARLLDP
jgi:DNA-binding Lrp family transcriptional regulator